MKKCMNYTPTLDNMIQLAVPNLGVIIVRGMIPNEGGLGIRILVRHGSEADPWIRSDNAFSQNPSWRILVQRPREDVVIEGEESGQAGVENYVEDDDFNWNLALHNYYEFFISYSHKRPELGSV